MSSRTCLGSIDNSTNLNDYQKLSMAILEPVRYVDDNNDVHNLYTADGKIQCDIPINTRSLFKVDDNNFMNVSKDLFWDNKSVTSDRNYKLLDNNIISNNDLTSAANDGYYNLYSEDINKIISFCNLINEYNQNIKEKKYEIKSNVDMTTNINNWKAKTKEHCNKNVERLSKDSTHLNNITYPLFVTTSENYFNQVKEYNKYYNQLSDKSKFNEISCKQYTFVPWDGSETASAMPVFPNCIPNLPPGSYINSCRNCSYDNNILKCDCEGESGNWVNSSLNIPNCGGSSINNINGNLQCTAPQSMQRRQSSQNPQALCTNKYNIQVGYGGRPNCKDTCTFYAFMNNRTSCYPQDSTQSTDACDCIYQSEQK